MSKALESIIGTLNAALLADEPIRGELVNLAHRHLGEYLKPAPDIKDMGAIYTSEGYIHAIKRWKDLNNLGLKEAKNAIDAAIYKYKWIHNWVGETFSIFSTDDNLHGRRCVVTACNQGDVTCMVRMCDTYETDCIPVTLLKKV